MKIEYLFIKPQNDFCQTVEQFKNILASNVQLTFSSDKLLTFKKKTFDYSISTYNVDNKKHHETVFYLQIVSTSESDDLNTADKMEELDRLLRRINSEYGCKFIINTIWDDVTMLYANKLFPRIVEVENLLRKIIYRFMIKISGSNWFSHNVPGEVKSSISKTLEKNDLDEDTIYSDQLYYADFIQLSIFFFGKYTLKQLDQNAVSKLKNAISEDKEKAITLLDEYEAKSNWERYFADKISVDDLSTKWNTLYAYRNQVAHSKRMNKQEYEDALRIIQELKPAFEHCIENMDDIIITEEETEAAKDVAKETISSGQIYFHSQPGMTSTVQLLGKTLGGLTPNPDGMKTSLMQFGTSLQKVLVTNGSVICPQVQGGILSSQPYIQGIGANNGSVSLIGQTLSNSPFGSIPDSGKQVQISSTPEEKRNNSE